MVITLYYTQLKHDIDQWTFRLADGRLKENVSTRDNAQADSTDSDTAYYLRLIRQGVAHLKAVYSSEITNSTDDADDSLSEPDSSTSWAFTFNDDSDVNCDSTALAEILHRFVVLHVILDWAGTYAPDALQGLATEVSETTSALNKALYSMEAPVKHRRPSFDYIESITIE